MRPFRRSSREPKNLAVAGFETAGIFSWFQFKDGSANRELRSNGLIRVKVPSACFASGKGKSRRVGSRRGLLASRARRWIRRHLTHSRFTSESGAPGRIELGTG